MSEEQLADIPVEESSPAPEAAAPEAAAPQEPAPQGFETPYQAFSALPEFEGQDDL